MADKINVAKTNYGILKQADQHTLTYQFNIMHQWKLYDIFNPLGIYLPNGTF